MSRSIRSTASASSSDSFLPGSVTWPGVSTGAKLSATPTSAAPAERSTRAASPCPSSMWCAAVNASAADFLPGAWMPAAWPMNAATHGSFSVSQVPTRSPSRSCTTCA